MIASLWGEQTWTDVRDRSGSFEVAILPLGAVEAHGPHLPLVTDGVIAQAMAEAAREALASAGVGAVILPRLDYAPADFAAAFPGTLSIRAETLTQLILDISRGLARQEIEVLAIANAHLDPAQLGALHAAGETIQSAEGPAWAFPDLTRRRWAGRLGEEFLSGACHAGRYEGSVVLARRPELVHQERMAVLEPNPRSLSVAIRDGLDSFESAGGPEAYFGDPAAATAEEGRGTIATLGSILAECVLEVLAHPVGRSGGEAS